MSGMKTLIQTNSCAATLHRHLRNSHHHINQPVKLVGIAVAFCFIILLSTPLHSRAQTPSSQPAGAGRDPSSTTQALALVRGNEQARIRMIHQVAPTVGCLYNRGNRAGGGSGVIIDADGYGLTNFHVVAGMLKDREGDVGLSDGRIYEMEVLGIDPSGDVAMFRATGRNGFNAAQLGNSDMLRVGDTALAMGNPFLLAEDFTPTITMGIISGLHRYQAGQGTALRYTDCIQVDTSINPGNSGGPLFDINGDVIGINGRVSIEERDRVNVGVGYAIAINQVKRFIPMLRAGLTTKHATAGFTVTDRRHTVVIDEILKDSTAHAAGLRVGDKLKRFGGQEIPTANRFASVLGTYPSHWPIDIVYEREGRENTVRIRLEDLPLPKANGPSNFDPYARHPVTDAANKRAVARALRKYVEFTGGSEALARITAIHFEGKRSGGYAATLNDTPIKIDERADASRSLDEKMMPVDMESAIRWQLMNGPKSEAGADYRVVAADEILGRIAIVLEAQLGKFSYQVAFDDNDGQLLRIEFKEALTGKNAQYVYNDVREVNGIRLPHRRQLFLNDAGFSEDRFEKISVEQSAPRQSGSAE